MPNAPETMFNNRDRIAALAQSYEAEMVGFLRDLVAIPAESSHEKPVIERIRREMEKVGFDEIRTDPMGNLLGRIGSGKKIIMMDSHTDAVGVGDPKEWAWDPYKGKVEDGFVYGRASSDQRGGMASLVYAGKIIKELGLAGDYTLYVVGSVQEEDCDGLAWLYILKEDGIPRGLRGADRAHQSAGLPGPARTDGDGSAFPRPVVPRQRAGARRQPDLQNDAPGARDRSAEHAPARRCVPGQGDDCGDGHPLDVALAVRGARGLLHPPGPAPDHGRDQGKRGGGSESSAGRPRALRSKS